jgi:hypothetical protein
MQAAGSLARTELFRRVIFLSPNNKNHRSHPMSLIRPFTALYDGGRPL